MAFDSTKNPVNEPASRRSAGFLVDTALALAALQAQAVHYLVLGFDRPVLACALHDGIADLMPKSRAEPDFTPFAEMLKTNNVSHLLGVFSAMRAQVESRREFHDAIADKGTRERLVAALLQ